MIKVKGTKCQERKNLEKVLTSSDIWKIESILAGKGELEDHMNLYEKLFKYFSVEEMPYGTQKARTGDPYNWIYDKLDSLFSD